MNRILVITDTWHPQVNGVVRSLEALATAALDLGANVQFLTAPRISLFPDADLSRNSARCDHHHKCRAPN
jgi:hypothetical protein